MILIIQPVCIQNIMLFSGASYNIKYTSYSRKISLSMMDTLVCWISPCQLQTCASCWGSGHGLCTIPAAFWSWGRVWVPWCLEGLTVLRCAQLAWPSGTEQVRGKAFWRASGADFLLPLPHYIHGLCVSHLLTILQGDTARCEGSVTSTATHSGMKFNMLLRSSDNTDSLSAGFQFILLLFSL